MPGAMWLALADGWDRAMKGFWKTFRSGMSIQRTGYRFTLTRPSAWPIEITVDPQPSYDRPKFDLFRARFGTKSEAAQGLEFGGVALPQRARWIAIPIAGARSRATGRLLPGAATPDKARKTVFGKSGRLSRRGKAFLAEKTRNPDVILLYPLVKPKRKRGRPRKGKRNPNRLVPGPVPAYMLVRRLVQKGDRIGLQRSWLANQTENERRLEETVGRAIRDVLAGKKPTVRVKSKGFAS